MRSNDCRGISVIATMGRIYSRLIEGKLEGNIKGKIEEDQVEFTTGISYAKQIHTNNSLRKASKGQIGTYRLYGSKKGM